MSFQQSVMKAIDGLPLRFKHSVDGLRLSAIPSTSGVRARWQSERHFKLMRILDNERILKRAIRKYKCTYTNCTGLKRELGASVAGDNFLDIWNIIERVLVRWFEAAALRGSVGLSTKVVPNKTGVTFVGEDRLRNAVEDVVFTVRYKRN